MVTTPFKRLGIYGWTDLQYSVATIGTVEQVAESTDKFLTVDLRIDSMLVNEADLVLPPASFIRAEICLADIGLSECKKPRLGQKVRIAGRLMWDGDGFLEIHPQRRADVDQWMK